MKSILKILKGIFFKLVLLRAYSSFKLKSKSFIGGKSSWRVSGWYFVYTYSNGQQELIRCPWILSNQVYGSGVCGWHTKYSEISSISYSFNEARRFHRKHSDRRHEKYNWFKLKYFFFKKQGGDYDKIYDELIDMAVNSAIKGMKK